MFGATELGGADSVDYSKQVLPPQSGMECFVSLLLKSNHKVAVVGKKPTHTQQGYPICKTCPCGGHTGLGRRSVSRLATREVSFLKHRHPWLDNVQRVRDPETLSSKWDSPLRAQGILRKRKGEIVKAPGNRVQGYPWLLSQLPSSVLAYLTLCPIINPWKLNLKISNEKEKEKENVDGGRADGNVDMELNSMRKEIAQGEEVWSETDRICVLERWLDYS